MAQRSGHLPLEFRETELGRHRRDDVLLSFGVPAGMVTALQAPVALGELCCRVARGSQAPAGGAVAIFGRDTRTFGAKDLERLEHRVVAVLAAIPRIHDDLALIDNATLTARMLGMRARPVVNAARALFSEAGMGQDAERRPPQVGALAVRMTAVIRAVVAHPSLVIVEPEAIDTDVQFAESCCRVLREFAAETGAGVFWTTSSTRLACAADRAWTYSLGRAVDLDS